MQTENSGFLKIDIVGLKKVGIGFLIALGGVALTYWQDAFLHIDFGQWQMLAVAVNSAFVNLAKKLLTDYSNR